MAQPGNADRESRFCGEVCWADSEIPLEIIGCGSVTENDLNTEAKANPPFQEAWEAAKTDPKLSLLKGKYNTLMEKEIKLIMAYTYNLPGKFYKHLNSDYREVGVKYPFARKVLRQALIKLSKTQPPLPPVELYRTDPKTLIDVIYSRSMWLKAKVLKQFTSTSRSPDKCIGSSGSMLTIFKNPIHGADIADFSLYDEEEVLLIPEYGIYKVESVNKQAMKVVLISAN